MVQASRGSARTELESNGSRSPFEAQAGTATTILEGRVPCMRLVGSSPKWRPSRFPRDRRRLTTLDALVVGPSLTPSPKFVGGGRPPVRGSPSTDCLERELRAAVRTGVAVENRQRAASKSEVTALVELIGDRPAGETKMTDPLVSAAISAHKTVGKVPTFVAASTDFSTFP